MALVALTTDQKEQLKSSSKFNALVRVGATNKAIYWTTTVDPGNVSSLPGGVGNTATYVRWAKSRDYAAQIIQNPLKAEQDATFVAFFLQNLNAAVWDNVAINPFNADAVILAMESNPQLYIDAAIDSAFDAMIKYSPF